MRKAGELQFCSADRGVDITVRIMARVYIFAVLSLFCSICVVESAFDQCKIKTLPSHGTRRYFRMQINGERCFNPDAVEGVTECKGGCDSISMYTPGNTTIDRRCECCIPTGKPNKIEVTIECPSGATFTRHVFVPSDCICDPCDTLMNINADVPIPK